LLFAIRINKNPGQQSAICDQQSAIEERPVPPVPTPVLFEIQDAVLFALRLCGPRVFAFNLGSVNKK
jgi:hypothetical protein